jgi:hypothetical protein
MRLLDYKEVLFLIFLGISTVYQIAVPIYIPANIVQK